MMGQPIRPFEPISSDRIPTGDRWIAQVKWDGVRVLVYDDGEETRLFNRKKNERTRHYPELTDTRSYCSADSVILDGEVVALGPDGRPSFHEVMKRDGLRQWDQVRHRQKQVPVFYMIFDIVYCNGQWLHRQPLEERLERLAAVVRPHPQVRTVAVYEEGDALFERMKQKAMEGVVVKRLDSPYVINGKDDRWQKIKHYKDLTAVIGGVTFRNGRVNAVLLGLYDHTNNLHYIGHAGSGKLTVKDWHDLTNRIQPFIREHSPFFHPPSRRKGVVWLQPNITVRIQYLEWPEGHSIRQPSIQAIVDSSLEQCVMNL